jgi:hypothetical protein
VLLTKYYSIYQIKNNAWGRDEKNRNDFKEISIDKIMLNRTGTWDGLIWLTTGKSGGLL